MAGRLLTEDPVGCDDLERELIDSSLGRDVESPNQEAQSSAFSEVFMSVRVKVEQQQRQTG